jgi:hypothetical protein
MYLLLCEVRCFSRLISSPQAGHKEDQDVDGGILGWVVVILIDLAEDRTIPV